MYPKDRLPRGVKATQMPPNLATLFAHIMCRTTEGRSSRGSSTPHTWDEVLQPPIGSSTDTAPFPMSAQDWRKAEAFSVQLQALIAARDARRTAIGSCRRTAEVNGDATCPQSSSPFAGSASTADDGEPSPPVEAVVVKPMPYANGKPKGKGRPSHASSVARAVDQPPFSRGTSSSDCTATPAPSQVTMPRQHAPRVTPKEPSRACGEPSAPIKVVGRVAAARRVNGAAEGAIASLAVSRAGPGAFETPSHLHHHTSQPEEPGGGGVHTLDREASPSRYPARLRSRRFPPLGGTGDMEELPQMRDMGTGIGHGGDKIEGNGDPPNGVRRFSPRETPALLLREEVSGSRELPTADQHYPNGWASSAGHVGSAQLDRSEEAVSGKGNAIRLRTTSKSAGPLVKAETSVTPRSAVTPKPTAVKVAAPPVNLGVVRAISSSSSCAGSSNAKAQAPPRPRQVLQGGGGRSGSRTPMQRSSVGGRNYTDNHVKQLGLIEAAVVAGATAQDKSTYNLPRQGRTLTLTNVFKFVALRGAGNMYALANAKQVEAHTGRHSNFFDGKIDARIVGIIKKDIGDEAITKSRKFSKILLSLVAEGCTSPDCDWDNETFTSENIARMQAKMEAETGTSALQHVINPVAAVNSTASSVGAVSSSVPPSSPGGAAFGGAGGSSSGSANGGPSKRRLDLGRDEGHTPSPRVKKLKRNARARYTGAESTPTSTAASAAAAAASSVDNSDQHVDDDAKSPPKEEDDMRAAEVLQGLKDVGGS